MAEQDDRLYIACRVRDNGYGIAEPDKARLFTAFQRIESSNRDRQKGIGLGLVFVKIVAEKHGGMVEVASEPGKGSTFSILIPHLTERMASL
ncbi:Histidine kinase-, DNA gyrase B-, and HSP90-like ATPase [Noviherbaspirillum humi]|uniref:histidine kinase n=1 Tax=Noviherbaspirillum humi TaxID=1688639 RepID=A0A239INL3_9BURK|nr:Histidine kinase-, DNA gyrase B-, and HSP90-like ATPase [Noviherbaspirillum humi]